MNERRPYSEVDAERDKYPLGKPTPYKSGHKNYLENNDPGGVGDSTQGNAFPFVRRFGVPILFLIIALSLLMKNGVNRASVTAVAMCGLFLGIPWYFSTRDRGRPPSAFETFAATFWLGSRRIVCCGGGVLLVLAVLIRGKETPFLASLTVLIFGFFMISVGWFGQGNDRSRFSDDLELHKKNKKRYKWRF
jgi:hypothetical protein